MVSNSVSGLPIFRRSTRTCKHAKFQFILSSGATSVCELVSGRSFDSLLETCGIDPMSYWNDLDNWLQIRLIKRHTNFA